MTIVVLLILVVVWAAVLAPSLFRRRAARRSSDSIGEFHHHLRVLRRTGPAVVNPAFRLTTSSPEESSGPRRPAGGTGGRLILIRPDAPLSAPDRSSLQRPDRYFRPEACKRRRDVLLCMVCVILGTAVLGSIPVLRPMLVLTAVALVVSALYVVMVVRLGSRASERTAKLRYLPEPMEAEPSIVIRRHAAR